MQIHRVIDKAALRQFIRFPYQLYRTDNIWVPPLRTEQWAQFNPKRNRSVALLFIFACYGRRGSGRDAES